MYAPDEEFYKRLEVLDKLKNLFYEWVKDVSLKKNIPEHRIDKVGGRLYTFGSYRMGLITTGSDIDTLCVVPRHIERLDFFTSFYENLKTQEGIKDIRSIMDAFVPVIKLTYDGIDVGLLIDLMLLLFFYILIWTSTNFILSSLLLGSFLYRITFWTYLDRCLPKMFCPIFTSSNRLICCLLALPSLKSRTSKTSGTINSSRTSTTSASGASTDVVSRTRYSTSCLTSTPSGSPWEPSSCGPREGESTPMSSDSWEECPGRCS